jgi:hypothetical protein
VLPDISEFSYGFALVRELIDHYELALTGAPRFPTQNEEGQEGGYDVALPKLGVPVFLQIKRSECLVRRSASEALQLGLPHYRCHLRPTRHSRQHELLLQTEAGGGEVYYAAPRFHLTHELDAAYQKNEVALRSTLIPPSEIGPLPDDRDHYVAMKEDGSQWLLCSRERRPLHAMKPETVLRKRVPQALRKRSILLDAKFFQSLADQIVERFIQREVRYYVAADELETPIERVAVERQELVQEVRRREEALRSKARQVRGRRRPDEFAREVAQTLLGCELLVALQKDQQ